MEAGRLDKPATFRGRAGDELDQLFEDRGPMVDLFTVSAEFRPLSGRAAAEAGSLTDAIEGVLIVRDTPRTRKLTVAHRVRIGGRVVAGKVEGGRELAIVSVPPSDRSGWLTLKLQQTKASA